MSDAPAPSLAVLRAANKINDVLSLRDIGPPPFTETEERHLATIIEQETATGALVQALSIQLADNGHTHSCNALREKYGQPAVECHGRCYLVKEALAKNRLGSEWTEANPCDK